VKLREVILSERNESVSPQSVTMWFKRHPDSYEQLKKQVIIKELSREEVSESIFQNGAFEKLASIQKWVKDLALRKARKTSIQNFIRRLKRVCKGQIDHKRIEDWSLKHPDRLTIEQAKDYLYECQKAGLQTGGYRVALRSFFTSKYIVVSSSDISGKLDDYGKYSDLYAPRQKIYSIFDFLKAVNKEAYLISKFMYKTATRITASLRANISNVNFEEHTITLYDKGHNGTDQKWTKLIPDDLWTELELETKEGKLFNINVSELNSLLRSAYRKIIPELNSRIPFPSHFWRHQFAQHMLRASDWNYGLVASLGGWSLEALRRYYGMPPQAVIQKFGLKHLPKI